MSENHNFFFSNRVEALFDIFKNHLFEGTSPFARRILIVPSPAMKTWLTVRMAEDPAINIAAGIEYYTLDEGIEVIRKATATDDSRKILPSAMELTLKIEVEIRRVIRSYATLPHREQTQWDPLLRYLKVQSDGRLQRRGEKRLASLAEKLAHHFKQYGRYGGGMLEEWREQPSKEWQSLLWTRLYHLPQSSWTYPYALYESETPSPSSNLSVHLFAISYLSALQHRYLQNIAAHYNVTHYLLSPCALFWSDLRSDRETAHTLRHWRERGASSEEQEQLEELLRDRNALLANFGRLGREMAAQIEESPALTEELYVVDGDAALLPQHAEHLYDELCIEKPRGNLSLLHTIQNDMVLLRNPEGDDVIDLESDSSIQLHIAPNKMREVEILYDTFLNLIDTHASCDDPITPSDIIVLAPDISEYEPYIKAVFGAEESKLDCQIMDLSAPSQSHLIKDFLHLLSLPSTQWDAKAILQLFDSAPFQRRHQLSSDDIETIREWIQTSGIRWGESSSHRDELLLRDHCSRGMVDKNRAGTWEHGFSLLIDSLVTSTASSASLTGAPNVYTSQSVLLGKVTLLMRSLRDDMRPLGEGIQLPIGGWADYIESLLESYFSVDPSNSDQERLLRKHIQALRQAALSVKEEQFPFTTVERHFTVALNKEEACYRESHLQSVKFCSMLPMRAVPARIVALMGMDEEAYPKKDLFSSLNAMSLYQDVDYCPSQTDYDRLLFLEILLSARDHIIMSYSSLSQGSDHALPPSLLITELMSYLDAYYRVKGCRPSEQCVYHHPYTSYDSIYFQKETPMRSFSFSRYRAALSCYHAEEKLTKPFIEDFAIRKNPPCESDIVIDIKDLRKAVKNPLQTYFNKNLGIYLDSEEDNEIKTEENFNISGLDNYLIKKTSLKLPLDHVLNVAEVEGKLPMGLFKEAAIRKLRCDMTEMEHVLSQAGIAGSDFFDIELSEQCEQVTVNEDGTMTVPSLQIQVDEITATIIGTISDVTPRGLAPYTQNTAEKLLGAWADYVVLCCLIDTHSLPIEKQVIPLRDKKLDIKASLPENPKTLLKKLIELYTLSIENPSPLFAEWVGDIVNGDANSLKKSIETALVGSKYQKNYNEYLKWIVDRTDDHDTEVMIQQWKPHADYAVSHPFTAWFPSKKTKTKEPQ